MDLQDVLEEDGMEDWSTPLHKLAAERTHYLAGEFAAGRCSSAVESLGEFLPGVMRVDFQGESVNVMQLLALKAGLHAFSAPQVSGDDDRLPPPEVVEPKPNRDLPAQFCWLLGWETQDYVKCPLLKTLADCFDGDC